MSDTESQLRIVLPDGSMEEKVKTLMAKAGMPVTVGKRRTKEGTVPIPWIDSVVFQRPQEIPHWLFMGLFDVAICGEDWIAEWGYSFPVLAKLPIGRGGSKPVRIVIAVSKESGMERVSDLPYGAKIATEYTRLTSRYFHHQSNRSDIQILPSYGNTEHKIRFGADAIVDVTETGRALEENGLKIIEELMESNTVLVATEATLGNAAKRRYIDFFARLIVGAHDAARRVMIIANVPDSAVEKAAEIMGGLQGPTCAALRKAGWQSLTSIIDQSREIDVHLSLGEIGATDVVVFRDIPLVTNLRQAD